MSSGIGDTISSLPPYAIPLIAVGVVGLLLLKNNGGGASYGVVRNYEPVPTDPGVVAMHNAEISAKTSAFESTIGMIGARDISRISADRDIAISSLSAQADMARTNAAVAIDTYRTQVAQTLGLASYDANVKLGMEDARVRSALGTQALDVERYGIQQNASVAKNQTNKNFVGGIIKDITDFGKTILPFLF